MQRTIDRHKTNYRAACAAVRSHTSTLHDVRRTHETLKEAAAIAQEIAKQVQDKAHAAISHVVTKALSIVFDEPYEFRIVFEAKRGKTEPRMIFVKDGEEFDPMSAAGGGVVDVAAFALRISALLLTLPPQRRVLIMDEPLRFLSADYHERAKEMIETLAEELGIQFIIVTHITGLETGFVFEVE